MLWLTCASAQSFSESVISPKPVKMPFVNLFRTIRVGSLIGISLALSHLLEANPRNYVAIGVNIVLFFFLFGVNHGFERWFTLVLVATSVYFLCMYAEGVTDALGGPVIGRVNEASGSVFKKLFMLYEDAAAEAGRKAASSSMPTLRQEVSRLRPLANPTATASDMSLLRRLWKAKVSSAADTDDTSSFGVALSAQDAVRVVSEPGNKPGWKWFS